MQFCTKNELTFLPEVWLFCLLDLRFAHGPSNEDIKHGNARYNHLPNLSIGMLRWSLDI